MVKNLPANAGDAGSIRKILWRRKWQPTPVFLPGKSHGQRRLAGHSPWGCKQSDMTWRLNTTTTMMKRPWSLFTLLQSKEKDLSRVTHLFVRSRKQQRDKRQGAASNKSVTQRWYTRFLLNFPHFFFKSKDWFKRQWQLWEKVGNLEFGTYRFLFRNLAKIQSRHI